ncbi:hypothetical protein M885DRAFT_623016 [Pelagophyceae sp. CCMP2097]|nr:hypothetical protein M885DRAFT_623016 [Pelagophyceae sp. CCMP2097]
MLPYGWLVALAVCVLGALYLALAQRQPLAPVAAAPDRSAPAAVLAADELSMLAQAVGVCDACSGAFNVDGGWFEVAIADEGVPRGRGGENVKMIALKAVQLPPAAARRTLTLDTTPYTRHGLNYAARISGPNNALDVPGRGTYDVGGDAGDATSGPAVDAAGAAFLAKRIAALAGAAARGADAEALREIAGVTEPLRKELRGRALLHRFVEYQASNLFATEASLSYTEFAVQHARELRGPARQHARSFLARFAAGAQTLLPSEYFAALDAPPKAPRANKPAKALDDHRAAAGKSE